MKISPRAIIRAHRRTYANAATGEPSKFDYLLFELIPLEAAIICVLWPVQFMPGAATALLTVSGLVGTILFGFLLQVSQRALDWSDTNPVPSRESTNHAQYLRQLAANSAYASLVCLGAAGTYLVASVATGVTLSVASGLAIGLTLHLTLVLLMVMKRVFFLTEQRLIVASTGATRQKRAS